jgi:hypothetical protein
LGGHGGHFDANDGQWLKRLHVSHACPNAAGMAPSDDEIAAATLGGTL